MEGIDADDLLEQLDITQHSNLLMKLQLIHDKHNPTTWPIALATLAKEEGLTYHE